MNQRHNYEAVYRTALGTLGLLMILLAADTVIYLLYLLLPAIDTTSSITCSSSNVCYYPQQT